MAQMAARQAQLVARMNAFTQAQSQGHRQRNCEPTGSVGRLWDYIQSGRLLPDVVQWGKHELTTNPFWQQQITPQDIWPHVLDFDQQVNSWFNEGVDHVVQQVTDLADYVREHPVEASASLAEQIGAAAQRTWQEIKAHPLETTMIVGGAMIVAGSAIAVVASGGALLPVIVAGMATGAVSGAAGQAIEDVATGQFSGWGAYVKQTAIGTAIGGVTGVIGAGAAALGLSSVVTGFASGATAGVFSQALINAWEGRSWHEGLWQAGLTGGAGGTFAGFVLGFMPSDAGIPVRMAVGSGVSGVTAGVTHALMNEWAGQDWREGLGRAIAVGITTGAVDAVTDYYSDRWQAQQEANRRGWTVDAGGEDTNVALKSRSKCTSKGVR